MDMLPNLPKPDLADSRFRDTEGASHFDTGARVGADRRNLGFGELGVAVCASSGRLPLAIHTPSSSTHHVGHVVGASADGKMRGVDTVADMARVPRLEPRRDRADEVFVGEAVRSYKSRTARPPLDHSVAIGPDRAAPQPTGFGALDLLVPPVVEGAHPTILQTLRDNTDRWLSRCSFVRIKGQA